MAKSKLIARRVRFTDGIIKDHFGRPQITGERTHHQRGDNIAQLLAAALRHHAEAHPFAKVEASPFGVRYIVEGIMKTPDGRTPKVRSVWFIDHGEDTPRFVTAYPLERKVP